MNNAQQTAWLAALIEGEGCLYENVGRSVSVVNTDRDVIARVHEWLGLGRVYSRQPPGDRKRVWMWTAYRPSDIAAVLPRIGGFLCSRRFAKAKDIAAHVGAGELSVRSEFTDDEHIAWIAGIVEGEGALMVKRTKAKAWLTPVLKVAMTDEDTILRLQEWSGVGNVTTRQPRAPRKRVWEWRVSRQEELLPLVRKIRPLLCARRGRQADAMIAALEEKQANGGMGRGRQHRVKTHCPKGHPYSGSNLMVNSHNGGRNCRICDAEAGRRWRSRNPERVREVRRAARKRYYAKNAARLRREALARYHARKTA